MKKYLLVINIHSESKELLENLMITLETLSDDLQHLSQIELSEISSANIVQFDTRPRQTDESNILQRNLFLDRWMV